MYELASCAIKYEYYIKEGWLVDVPETECPYSHLST